MFTLNKALIVVIAGLTLTGCAVDRRASSDTAIFLDGDRLHTGTGATINYGSGSVSGAGPRPEAKEPRGNTPPGTSRDGSKPAEGAIVDPSGAATK